MTPAEKSALYERLQSLPADLAAELERRENDLIQQGADEGQMEALHRLFVRQLELRGL
jgi:hypothetical protein